MVLIRNQYNKMTAKAAGYTTVQSNLAEANIATKNSSSTGAIQNVPMVDPKENQVCLPEGAEYSYSTATLMVLVPIQSTPVPHAQHQVTNTNGLPHLGSAWAVAWRKLAITPRIPPPTVSWRESLTVQEPLQKQ
jgi:hypothetical protein